MKRNKKHINKDLEKFLDYSVGKMTSRERNIFEKDLEKNSFDSEAAEGLSSISPQEARNDMQELNKWLSTKTSRSNRFIFYRIAAAVAVLVVVGSIIILVTNNSGRISEQAAVTDNIRSEKNINGEENAKQVIPEEPLTERAVPEQNIQTNTKKETVRVSESNQDLSISETSEDKAKEIAGVANKDITIKEDDYLVSADKEPELNDKKSAMPAISASKSESPDRSRIITRKYVDNYVHGVVLSSEDRLPLPGAIVKIRGTTAGTYTDNNGNFELPVQPESEITLVADYIGMKQSEVRVDTAREVQITLDPAESALNEVVVVGYGVQEESKITGAVSTVDMDESPDWQLPSPVIGTRKFKEYVKENIQFPVSDTIDTRAVVVLNFIVAENGRPKNITVLKSPGRSFSDEAIRLLVSGPDWYPARHKGEITETETMIRIVFKREY
jgi:CarboxypepD_reg-like domain/Gram-negative bacterial TonB protein C-terminal